jgi:hypothetical protein
MPRLLTNSTFASRLDLALNLEAEPERSTTTSLAFAAGSPSLSAVLEAAK